MKSNTLRLFQVSGIPIGLDPSWFLVFALVTWLLAVTYFPTEFPQWSSFQYWSVAVITSLIFFACVLLHELGHSVVALHYKLQVKNITMHIFGGISQITSEPDNPKVEFAISFAGPFVSLVLAGVFYLLQLLFTGIEPLFAIVKYLALINFTLTIFNLIPGFPLDGGRVFRAIIWGITHNLRRATEIAVLLGRAIAFLLILLGVWFIFKGDWTSGLWIAFIGWFLESAAVSQIQQQRVHLLLAGHTVEQVMSRSCVMASADLTLQELVDQFILDKGQRCLILMRGDEVVGLTTLHHIRDVPRQRWATTAAAEVMTPISEVQRLSPEAGLEKALEQMGVDGVNQMPVMKDGQVEGMLRREDIISYLKLLKDLEK